MEMAREGRANRDARDPALESVTQTQYQDQPVAVRLFDALLHAAAEAPASRSSTPSLPDPLEFAAECDEFHPHYRGLLVRTRRLPEGAVHRSDGFVDARSGPTWAAFGAGGPRAATPPLSVCRADVHRLFELDGNMSTHDLTHFAWRHDNTLHRTPALKRIADGWWLADVPVAGRNVSAQVVASYSDHDDNQPVHYCCQLGCGCVYTSHAAIESPRFAINLAYLAAVACEFACRSRPSRTPRYLAIRAARACTTSRLARIKHLAALQRWVAEDMYALPVYAPPPAPIQCGLVSTGRVAGPPLPVGACVAPPSFHINSTATPPTASGGPVDTCPALPGFFVDPSQGCGPWQPVRGPAWWQMWVNFLVVAPTLVAVAWGFGRGTPYGGLEPATPVGLLLGAIVLAAHFRLARVAPGLPQVCHIVIAPFTEEILIRQVGGVAYGAWEGLVHAAREGYHLTGEWLAFPVFAAAARQLLLHILISSIAWLWQPLFGSMSYLAAHVFWNWTVAAVHLGYAGTSVATIDTYRAAMVKAVGTEQHPLVEALLQMYPFFQSRDLVSRVIIARGVFVRYCEGGWDLVTDMWAWLSESLSCELSGLLPQLTSDSAVPLDGWAALTTLGEYMSGVAVAGSKAPEWLRVGSRLLATFMAALASRGWAAPAAVFDAVRTAGVLGFTLSDVGKVLRDLADRALRVPVDGWGALFSRSDRDPIVIVERAQRLSVTPRAELCAEFGIDPAVDAHTRGFLMLGRLRELQATCRKTTLALGSDSVQLATTLTRCQAEISTRINEEAAFLASHNRVEPTSFLVAGPPGVGKSTITELLVAAAAAGRGLPVDNVHTYVMSLEQPFHDRYDPAVHHTILVDDAFPTNPDKVGDATPIVTQVLALSNATPYALNCAQIENKGVKWLAHSTLVATANSFDLNAHHYGISGGAAIRRRFRYVCNVFLRAKYLKQPPPEGAATATPVCSRCGVWGHESGEGATKCVSLHQTRVHDGGECDLSAIMAAGTPEEPVPDAWHIVVHRIRAGGSEVEYDVVFDGGFWYFLEWVAAISRDRVGSGVQVRDAVRAAARVISVNFGTPPGVTSGEVASAVLTAAPTPPMVRSLRERARAVARAAFARGPAWLITLPLVWRRGTRALPVVLGSLKADVDSVLGYHLAVWCLACDSIAFAVTGWSPMRALARTGCEAYVAGAGRYFTYDRERELEHVREFLTSAATVFAAVAAIVGGAAFVRGMLRRGGEGPDVAPANSPASLSMAPTVDIARDNPLGWQRESRDAAKAEGLVPPDAAARRAGPPVTVLPPWPELATKREAHHRSASVDDLKALLARATKSFLVANAVDGGGANARRCTAIALGGTYYATCSHVFVDPDKFDELRPDHAWRIRVVEEGPRRLFSEAQDVHLVGVRQVAFDRAFDLAVFSVTRPPEPNILKWLPSVALSGRMGMHMVLARGVVGGVTGGDRRPDPRFPGSASLVFDNRGTDVLRVGDSGAFAVYDTGAERGIVGPQYAVTTEVHPQTTLVMAPTRDDVQRLIDTLRTRNEDTILTCARGVDFHSAYRGVVEATPHHKSIVHYVEPEVQVSGACLGFTHQRVHARMSVDETPLRAAVRNIQDELGAHFASPASGTFVTSPDGASAAVGSTYLGVFNGMGHQHGVLPDEAVFAADSYLDNYQGPFFECRPLTVEQAVFGGVSRYGPYPGVPRDTSMGQLGGVKRDHIDFERRVIPDWLLQRIESRRELCRDPACLVPGMFASWSEKDEARPVAKCASGSTRMINVIDGDLAILVRMYVLPLVIVMRHFGPAVSESAVGVNALDPEQWQRLFAGVARHQHHFAGDFGKFDKKSQLVIMLYGVLRVLLKLARRLGYTDDDRTVLTALFVSQCFPVTKIDDIIVVLCGTTVSGVCATTEENGLRVSITCRIGRARSYVLRWLDGGGPPTAHPATRVAQLSVRRLLTAPPFRDSSDLRTYGDDNVTGTEDPDVSLTAFARALATIGEEYTDDQKRAGAVAYSSMEEVTLLKRRALVVDGVWYAPLDRKSILKSVCYARRGEADPVVRDHEAARNALKEAWLHRDDPSFVSRLRSGLARVHTYPDGRVLDLAAPGALPTDDEIASDYARRTLTTWDASGPWATVVA